MASNTKRSKTIRRARDAKKLANRRKKTVKKHQKAVEAGLTIDLSKAEANNSWW